GELKPFSLDELSNRFETAIHKNDIITNISSFNSYIESIHTNINDAIIQVNLFKDDFTRADIQNILSNCGYMIEETEEFVYSIKFREEGFIRLEQFLESISYFQIDEKGIVFEKFFFTIDRDILKQLFPYLNTSTINILRNQFKKYIISEKEYYVINPTLYNIIFPLPIPQEYNLLDDKNETVRLWTEISRTKKGEIFNKRILHILTEFLLTSNKISKVRREGTYSKIRQINDFEYFENITDKNNFIILENFQINEFSNNPINIMLWREIGDYNNIIINQIQQNIGVYQRNELKNIHILILIAQNKILENLITELANNLDYTIVKELDLSMFTITKYAFLNEVKEKYQNLYNQEKFDLALKNLISSFDDIKTASLEDIKNKGLTININNRPSNLSNIPQLMKYILYDFQSDFKNYSNIELKKPFENINPIGLSPHFSSSIDDWSNEKLKHNIGDFLLANDFIRIERNSLIISMPKIEKNIFQLIKNFSNDNLEFSIEEIREFFFDKSDTPSLLKDVFLTDLENRGLITIRKGKKKEVSKIRLVRISELALEQKLNNLRTKIKRLRIKDRNFYHIFTIKQKNFSLIYLNDFINELDRLLNLKIDTTFNPYALSTKKILFERIFHFFNNIIDKIFIPLDNEISIFRKHLLDEKDEKFQFSYINSKLREFGLKDINIKNFSEIRELDEKLSDIIKKIIIPVDKKNLEENCQFYYKIHKNDVRLAGERFSYLKLQQNKLKKEFDKPYLNYLFFEMIEEKEQCMNDEVLKDINTIKKKIDKINTSYIGIKGQITKVSIGDSSQIALKIYEKVKNLSSFEFVASSRKVETLKDIIEFLNDLSEKVNSIHMPISQILMRKGRGKLQSLLDKIYFAEKSIKDHKQNIDATLKYLKQRNIISNESKIKKNKTVFDNLDYSDFILKIDSCQNLLELEEESKDIYNKMQIKLDSLNLIMDNLKNETYKFFKKFKDINALQTLFDSLEMKAYSKVCRSYLTQLKTFLIKDQEISFIDTCSNLLKLKKRIEKGYEEGLKKQLDEDTQMIYLELNDTYRNKKWFSELEWNKIIKKYNLTQEKAVKILHDLQDKKIIEKRYYFK
ncbi:MAG: hypothetical protein ACTSQG_04115, partial [Promethearchaeota archaeon]